jgi:hypothetical protein
MRAASLACAAAGILASGGAAAQASFALNTLYYCPNNVTFRVSSCAGPADADYCGVQMYLQGQAMPAGRSTRAQIMTLVPRCSTQGPLAGGSPAPAPTPAAAPYRPGGKFQENDHVKVNIRGQGWMDGTIVAITLGIDPEYKVQVPGKGVAIATEADLRFVSAGNAAAPAAAAPRAAGVVSCAGKFEGRYASPPGTPGMVTVVFRSGNADVTTPDMVGNANGVTAMQSTHHAECTTGGGKIYLRWLDGPNMDFTMDINDDGSLDTPYGEIVKKGH